MVALISSKTANEWCVKIIGLSISIKKMGTEFQKCRVGCMKQVAILFNFLDSDDYLDLKKFKFKLMM
jgi:hypothetical protein